jgi:hypothetical protein
MSFDKVRALLIGTELLPELTMSDKPGCVSPGCVAIGPRQLFRLSRGERQESQFGCRSVVSGLDPFSHT